MQSSQRSIIHSPRRNVVHADAETFAAVHDDQLGNRSALEWIVDRYRVKIDRRSGIANDPNQYADDPQYILKLIGKVVTVSLETVQIVNALPALE